MGTTITLTPASAPAPDQSLSPRRTQVTAFDLIERLLSYLGGNMDGHAHNDIRRAIVDAQREIVTQHSWTYLWKIGRLFMQAQQTEGTVEYDHTGGAYERLLTLTDSTWPSWAARGYVRIGSIVSWVQYRIDDTRLVLDPNDNPGQDIAAGTSYSLVQDTYQLPEDFVSTDVTLAEDNWGGMTFMQPAAYLSQIRFMESSGGPPRFFTFTGDPKDVGRLALRVYPGADTFQTVDFLYRRKPQDIKTWEEKLGKASVVGGSTSVTLADGGAFTNRMVGSIVRISDTVQPPTSLEGLNPFIEERQILQVLSASEAVVDQAIADNYSNVGYRISDPLDFDVQAMFNCVHAGAIKHLCRSRNRKDFDAASKQWLNELNMAREADNRNTGARRASLWGPYRQRLRDMPRGPDIE